MVMFNFNFKNSSVVKIHPVELKSLQHTRKYSYRACEFTQVLLSSAEMCVLYNISLFSFDYGFELMTVLIQKQFCDEFEFNFLLYTVFVSAFVNNSCSNVIVL